MIRALALLLALLAAAPAALAAVGDPAGQLPDPALEARAEAIGRELRCLVCQNQSIEDSDADLARDLRRIVREQVASGQSDRAVKDYLHDRYGDFVLLRPPFTAATALLWATPALALLGGGLLILARLRRRGAVLAAPPPPAELDAVEQARLSRLEQQHRGGPAA